MVPTAAAPECTIDCARPRKLDFFFFHTWRRMPQPFLLRVTGGCCKLTCTIISQYLHATSSRPVSFMTFLRWSSSLQQPRSGKELAQYQAKELLVIVAHHVVDSVSRAEFLICWLSVLLRFMPFSLCVYCILSGNVNLFTRGRSVEVLPVDGWLLHLPGT